MKTVGLATWSEPDAAAALYTARCCLRVILAFSEWQSECLVLALVFEPALTKVCEVPGRLWPCGQQRAFSQASEP